MYRLSLFLLFFLFINYGFSKEPSREIEELFENAPFDQKALTLTPAAPRTSEDQTVLFVAPLYFKTQIKGSSYVIENKEAELFLPQRGDVKSPSPGWDFGAKVGLGRIFNKDRLFAGAEFTAFRTTDSKSTKEFASGALIPLRGTFYNDVSFAKSSVKLSYYNLDIGLAKDFFISKRISLKPQMTVKSTWLKTFQKTVYATQQGPTAKNTYVEELSKMWGMGPAAALTTKWYVFEDVYFFEKTTISALYSYVRGYQTSDVGEAPSQNLHLFHKEHFFVPYLEVDLGICIYKLLNESKKLFQFSLAYESQYYFQPRQILDLEEFKDTLRVKTNYEDVSLYGLSFNVSLFF